MNFSRIQAKLCKRTALIAAAAFAAMLAPACSSDDEAGGGDAGSAAKAAGGSSGKGSGGKSGGSTGGSNTGGSSTGGTGTGGSGTGGSGTGGSGTGGSGTGGSGTGGSGTGGSGGGSGAGGSLGTGGSSGTGGGAGSASACGAVAPRQAPPLAAPTGTVVEVSTVSELMSAVSGASEGTTIMMENGTYYLPGLLRFNAYKKNVTLRSKSGDRNSVIIDGSQSSSDEMIWFEEVDGVTVADLTVQNANVHCFTIKGEADASGVRIYNVKIRHCWQRYIKGTAPNPISAADPAKRPRNGRIEYCLFEQDFKKTQDDLFNGDYIGGIDMMWLKNWVISDNVFKGIQGRNNGGRGAIFLWNESEDVLVERNRIHGCDTGIAFGNPSGGAVHMTRGIMRNNMITRGNYKAIELARTADSEIYNNTVYSENLSFDRVFHAFQGPKLAPPMSGTAAISIFDNLVHGFGVKADDGGTVENNLTGNFSTYFVDPANGDLHLTAAGAANVLGKATRTPAGILDFDAEPRPDPAAVGADECVP